MLTCYSTLSAASQVIIISFIAFYNSERLIPEILLARHLLALPEALVTGVYRRLCVYARETCVCVCVCEREREKERRGEREKERRREREREREREMQTTQGRTEADIVERAQSSARAQAVRLSAD